MKNFFYTKIKVNFPVERLSRTKWMINNNLHDLMYEHDSLKCFHMGGEDRLMFNYYENIGKVKDMYFYQYDNRDKIVKIRGNTPLSL